MNTNPHGKARCSIGPSSQYRSHVKYQHTARFNSSTNETVLLSKRKTERNFEVYLPLL